MRQRIITLTAIVAIVLILGAVAIVKPRVVSKIPPVLSLLTTKSGDEKAHQNAAREKASTCIACHGSMQTKNTPWHKKHLSASPTALSCSSCHKKIVAGPRTIAGKVLVDRNICPTCHRQKFVAFTFDHQTKDWINLHKQWRGGKEKCEICHNYKELNFCGNCHDFHPQGQRWVFGQHGPRAVKSNFECLQCHEKETWCTSQCHEGVTLPHNIPKWSQFWKDKPDAPKWREVHYRVAQEKGEQVCRRCHKPRSSEDTSREFCQQCHHQQFYKQNPQLVTPWIKAAMNYVKENGAQDCFKCHRPEFCVTCHTEDRKPPPGTTFIRRANL